MPIPAYITIPIISSIPLIIHLLDKKFNLSKRVIAYGRKVGDKFVYLLTGHLSATGTLSIGLPVLYNAYLLSQGDLSPEAHKSLVDAINFGAPLVVGYHGATDVCYAITFKEDIKQGAGKLKEKIVNTGRFAKELSSSLLDKFKDIVNHVPAYAEQTL